jgi:Aspartyl protease
MMSARNSNQKSRDINTFLIQKGYDAIPIKQNVPGHLLITVKVNGISGLFILDTGAGGSVIDSKQASKFNLTLQKDSTDFSGAGVGGLGLEVIQSEGNKIEIGNYVVSDFTLSVMSLEHVSQALIQIGAHEELLGVIGVDILKPGKAIIDYSNMILYLSSNK